MSAELEPRVAELESKVDGTIAPSHARHEAHLVECRNAVSELDTDVAEQGQVIAAMYARLTDVEAELATLKKRLRAIV